MVICIGGLPIEDIPLSLPIHHPQCSMLRDGLGLTSSFVVALFLLPLYCDFILVWVLEVVGIMLWINFYLYVSHFQSCSRQCLLVLVHICSSSPSKEVHSSLLKSICYTLLDLVRGITSVRNISSIATVEIFILSDRGCYCYVLL